MSEIDIVEEWMSDLRAELNLTGLEDMDVMEMLKVVREVAHGVIHPAAPLSMFVAGYAAALGGGSSKEVERILARISELAQGFAAKRSDA